MKIKTVIVDDEQPICDEAAYLLQQEQDVEIIGVFTNSIDALAFIMKEQPKLVFLDIMIPGLSGLELANKVALLKQPPLIVFLTAYTNHALEAFNTPAVGYITKPVTDDKIARVMQKVRTLLTDNTQKITAVRAGRLSVVAGDRIIPLDKNDIIFVYAKNKEVYVRTRKQEYEVMLTLQEIEGIFRHDDFMRVHRKYLVNLSQIKEIIPWSHGTYILRMNDCQYEIPVSRSNIRELKSAMGIH